MYFSIWQDALRQRHITISRRHKTMYRRHKIISWRLKYVILNVEFIALWECVSCVPHFSAMRFYPVSEIWLRAYYYYIIRMYMILIYMFWKGACIAYIHLSLFYVFFFSESHSMYDVRVKSRTIEWPSMRIWTIE